MGYDKPGIPWAPTATLVLEANYEAILWIAIIQKIRILLGERETQVILTPSVNFLSYSFSNTSHRDTKTNSSSRSWAAESSEIIQIGSMEPSIEQFKSLRQRSRLFSLSLLARECPSCKSSSAFVCNLYLPQKLLGHIFNFISFSFSPSLLLLLLHTHTATSHIHGGYQKTRGQESLLG